MNKQFSNKTRRILDDFKAAMREERRATLNATCPHCEADVLDKFEEVAFDWGGFGPANTAAFDCPGCGKMIMFRLHWETFLTKAEFIPSVRQIVPSVSPRIG